MIKTKLFCGSFGNKYYPNADSYCNAWLERNPNIEIIDIRYAQGGCGDHSICILYKEKSDG